MDQSSVDSLSLPPAPQPQPQFSKLLCCQCGLPIPASSPSFTCSSCLAASTDVTSAIATEAQLHQCRGCQRWHKEDNKWLGCELESRELMALCLHKISGLKNVKLVDASWIWTEPHSMRIKTKLTVQKEVEKGVILQQSFVVVFVVRNMQCHECQAEFTQGAWKSLVQVRQRVQHKRTFLYLEQAILKHNAHKGCLSIETFRDGMDFYFHERSKARSFIEFLDSVTPMQCKDSKKLIGTDVKSNISNYKFTHLVEICPLCKDDLLHLPKKVATSLGSLARLVLVKNVSSVIHLVDPMTGQTATMHPETFYRKKFRPLIAAHRSHLTRYVVLGKEAVVEKVPNGKRSTIKQRSRLAELTLMKEDDMGVSDAQYCIKSHLGYLLKAGDVVVGYHLAEATLVDDEAEELRASGRMADVVVVRKLYGGVARGENEAEAARARSWRLQKLDVEKKDEERENGNGKKSSRNDKKIKALDEMDEEDFLREIEADRELRANVNLYKYDAGKKKTIEITGDDDNGETMKMENNDEDMANEEEEEDGDDDDDQKVQLDELLEGLALNSGPDADAGQVEGQGESDAVGGNAGEKLYTEEELENMTETERFQISQGRTIFEQGEKAKMDKIGYIDKEQSKDADAKSNATVVKQFGTEFSAKDFKFI